MFEFEDVVIAVIFGSISLLLIALGVYLKIIDHKFKKNGIQKDFKVAKVKEEKQINSDGKIIGKFYITTFEFSHNGKTLEETLQTSSKFEVGSVISGIYLPTGKINKISVAGEGFRMSSRAEIFLIGLGLGILFYVIAALFNFSIKVVLIYTIIIVLIIIGRKIILKLTAKNK